MELNPRVRFFQRITLGIGLLGLTIFIPFYQFINGLPYLVQSIPFFISMVFLGLPHGAMDHLVPFKLSRTSRRKSILVVSLIYLVVGLVYSIVWYLEPVGAMLFFIVITWFHWGQGELYAVFKFEDLPNPIISFDKLVSLLLRGGIPMLVPLSFHKGVYESFLSETVGLFSAGMGSQITIGPQVGKLLLGLIGGLTVLNFILGGLKILSGQNITRWIYDNLEVSILWLYFALLNPVFAVGLYFCLWHSVRHISRLSLIEGQSMFYDILNGDFKAYILDIFKNTFLITSVSLLLLVLINLFVFQNFSSVESVLPIYMVFISVLTLPHILVVSWMDYSEGIWFDEAKEESN